jgi:hypothetical protein
MYPTLTLIYDAILLRLQKKDFTYQK